MTRQRSLAEQVSHRFGYAVTLYSGARKTCADGKAEIVAYGVPTFLLVGFSLENAFAAFLMASEHGRPGDYKSHDLVRALDQCRHYGLVLSKADEAFVRKITPFHKDFVFRYPEKMDRVNLGTFDAVLRATKGILRDVNICLKFRGFDVLQISEQLADAPLAS